MIIQPGPVVDFLIANQNVKDPYSIDWEKAKRTLKNLRVKTRPTNTEYKITGLSEKPCNEQLYVFFLCYGIIEGMEWNGPFLNGCDSFHFLFIP
uniref:PAZ domain-containing protein n=1 Tax=Lactuca sativa TaxID=4236 RepID=A0A9R1X2F4_LACSA|nr:hypothetical protein LSAT_V11C700348060 [Lactuca sativa]